MKRFVIRPGYVISQNDGDRHYVGVGDLMRLYGVNPAECLVHDEERTRWQDPKDYIVLAPRYHGDYKEHLASKLEERGWNLG